MLNTCKSNLTEFYFTWTRSWIKKKKIDLVLERAEKEKLSTATLKKKIGLKQGLFNMYGKGRECVSIYMERTNISWTNVQTSNIERLKKVLKNKNTKIYPLGSLHDGTASRYEGLFCSSQTEENEYVICEDTSKSISKISDPFNNTCSSKTVQSVCCALQQPPISYHFYL